MEVLILIRIQMLVHLFIHLYWFGGLGLDPHTNDRLFSYSPLFVWRFWSWSANDRLFIYSHLLVCSLGLKVSRVLSLPSGDDLCVNSLSDPVSMTFPIILGGGSSYKCKYLNTSTGQWSEEGVTTVQSTASQVKCQTTHLSSYAVFSGQWFLQIEPQHISISKTTDLPCFRCRPPVPQVFVICLSCT